jgi:hypothetical protein
MRVEKYQQLHQFYVIPTILYTYDHLLNGWLSIDIIWGKWGISIIWCDQNKNYERRHF